MGLLTAMATWIPPGAKSKPLASSVWKPVNPAHAIQRAAAIFEFAEPITSFAVGKIENAVRAEAKRIGLLKEEPLNTALFEIRPSGPPRPGKSEQVGTLFQDVQGEISRQALSVMTASIRFETGIYTRWIAFREQLANFMQLSLPIIEQNVRIRQVGLEYVDLFIAASPGQPDAALILDKKSRFLTQRAFDSHGPWHSHSGWFEGETELSRHLVNVDVDVADAQGPIDVRRAINIRTYEAEQIIDFGHVRAGEMTQLEPLLNCLDSLHTALKRHLSGILTNEARTMISLGK